MAITKILARKGRLDTNFWLLVRPGFFSGSVYSKPKASSAFYLTDPEILDVPLQNV